MPKLVTNKTEEKNRIIRGSIKNAKEIQGINISMLAKQTRIPASTLYAKIREPDTFTVRELRLIWKALRYTDQEKERVAREAF